VTPVLVLRDDAMTVDPNILSPLHLAALKFCTEINQGVQSFLTEVLLTSLL
jgi:hypothetical protein